MKNLFKTIVLVALAVSCAKETGSESAPDAATRRYNLSFAESTKTELSGTGSTRQVKWNSGDAIKYYTEPNQSNAASANVALNGTSAYIDIEPGRADVVINAVYGASQLNSGSSTENTMYVNSPVKNNQSYKSFSQAHICAAFSDDIENPNLTFHNAAAILKFTSAAAIHKIVFRGNNSEVITAGSNGSLKITHTAGALTVEPAQNSGTTVTVQTNGAESEFFIAVLPVQFEKGITVDCYDSNLELIATKKTTNAVNTVSASGAPKVLNLGNVQEWLNNPLPVAVDLGLSVKWARTNIGATVPEEYGDYFAWGETAPKSEYKWTNYAFEQGTGRTGPFSKYVIDAALGTVDHKTVLDPSDDAAHAILGGDWRMPTREEVEELMTSCQWTWTTRNGVSGYRVTSNKSGNSGVSIFLPANGIFGNSVSKAGTEGNYWSASLSADESNFAFSPYFSSSSIDGGNCYRYFGLGIRPVEGAVVPVASIEIPATMDLIAGSTATLSATILPSSATYRSLTWSSSDESVATVDANGKITAISIGKTTITIYSSDASKIASCEVIVREAKPETVDLGLSVKWASYNVGAVVPEDYGVFFAWGETEPKSNYSWSTYKWCNGDYNKLTKYCILSSYWDSSAPMDNKIVLDPDDDAAHIYWGGNWRIPTDAEWEELINNCTWTWSEQNGVNGSVITGRNGNSIFLPAAGGQYGAALNEDVGSYGTYWSSSLTTGILDCAYRSISSTGSVYMGFSDRCHGQSVRPVYGIVLVSSISIMPETIELFMGNSATLTATILPANATYKYVNWSSSDESVATVDANGKVLAVSVGKATITAYSLDKSKMAPCEIIVKERATVPNGYDYVDLGLPSGLKWASMNVGATKPEEYGDYFAWGETQPKSNYSWSTYQFELGADNNGPFSKYVTNPSYGTVDNNTVLDPEDDAARMTWGGSWRMPTDEEWAELRTKCTWIWTTQNGVNGRKVTGPNGKNIFLPAAGYRHGTDFDYAGSSGFYWSSSLGALGACSVGFYSSGVNRNDNYRYRGFSVRPVSE